MELGMEGPNYSFSMRLSGNFLFNEGDYGLLTIIRIIRMRWRSDQYGMAALS